MVTGRLVTSQQTFARDAGLGVRHTCDLHWQVSNRAAFSRLLPWERLAARRRPIPALDAEGLTPPHALLMACLHRVAHHFDAPTLIWLYDIHLLVSSMSDEEAARFVALAVDSGLATICARGIALAQHHFRTPLPARARATRSGRPRTVGRLPAQAVSSLRRVAVRPARVARVSRSLPVVARTPLSIAPLRARGPAAAGFGTAALAVRAPDRSRRDALVSDSASARERSKPQAISMTDPDGLGSLRRVDARASPARLPRSISRDRHEHASRRFGTARS